MIDRAIAPVARLRWKQYPVLTINQSGNGYEQVSTLAPGLP